MKKVLLLASGLLFFGATNLHAQNWVNNGNTLSGNGTVGTNSNHSLLFETYNTERGRISNTGLWGIGTTAPNSKFHINSITGQDPLRVQVNGITKLLVHRSGGVAAGTAVVPPADGLLVGGLVGLGTTVPNSRLHINSITNQDPLRVQVNNATKLLVHRGGGVSIGIANVPPANGLLVGGSVGIGGVVPSENTKLLVINKLPESYGIIANGELTGVYAEGKDWGIDGRSPSVGVHGLSEEGFGVQGYTHTGIAVTGSSPFEGTGGSFSSHSGIGLQASTFNGSFSASFNGDTYTYGANYASSDKNIKKNIQEINNAMTLINNLKPKYYEFKDDGKYGSLKLPKGNHYGLLAQDVEEVLPNLVKETTHEISEIKAAAIVTPSKDGKPIMPNTSNVKKEVKEKINIKVVNYNEFIPILIKGAQEQQAIIEQQQSAIEKQNIKIEELIQLVNKLTNSTGSLKATESYMSQSLPNPTNKSARINLTIPANATNASLLIHNMAGQQVKQIPLDKSGSIDINTSSFSAGTYSYSLYLDGRFIESKKLMVVK